MIKILIADDHTIVRRGLIQIIKEEYPEVEITEAGSGTEVLALMKNDPGYRIILLDISMPGKNGLETLKDLKAMGVETPILILSMHPEDQYAIRVLKSGASGFISKQSATEELLSAFEAVLQGKTYIHPRLSEKIARHLMQQKHVTDPIRSLSDRELQVLQMIASGKTVTQIAEEIFLSVNTISTYRLRILEKLHLKNNAELTRYAIDNGLA